MPKKKVNGYRKEHTSKENIIILILGRADFRARKIIKDTGAGEHYPMIESVLQEDRMPNKWCQNK
jgi:hypothetical protein